MIKKHRLKMVIPLAASVLTMTLVMPALMHMIHAKPGGKQEMFPLPFQMTARYATYYGNDITEEEYKVLNKVLPMEEIVTRYNPIYADPIKGYTQRGEDQDYIEYLNVWFKQGLRHPTVYISAVNNMLSGWFSWTFYDPTMNMEARSQQKYTVIPEHVAIRDFSAQTANAYQNLFYNIYKIPVMQIFFTYGFYASILPVFSFCTVFRKRDKTGRRTVAWTAYAPVLFSIILGCWLAPTAIPIDGRRYLYPLIYLSPMIIAWCLYQYRPASNPIPC